jgi:hypothetical protein
MPHLVPHRKSPNKKTYGKHSGHPFLLIKRAASSITGELPDADDGRFEFVASRARRTTCSATHLLSP